MMNKKVIIVAIAAIGVIGIGGGALAYTNNQGEKAEQEKMAMEKKAEGEAMMKKEEAAAAMEKEKMMAEGDAMAKDDVITKHGSYVTLADYQGNTEKYGDSKKVYFFHASWCPICNDIDEEITADVSKIPAGVTLIKTDFDNSTDLRQKYGVTTQYTFVQVDGSGNETAQWSATSLQEAIDGIES
jgi:hypothetical protein